MRVLILTVAIMVTVALALLLWVQSGADQGNIDLPGESALRSSALTEARRSSPTEPSAADRSNPSLGEVPVAPAPPPTPHVSMEDGFPVVIRCVLPNGGPADAGLSLELRTDAWNWVRRATTNDRGEAHFVLPQAVEWVGITLQSEVWAPAMLSRHVDESLRPGGVQLTDGDPASGVLFLSRLHVVRGRLQSRDAGLVLGGRRLQIARRVLRTDSDGRFVYRGLADGRYGLRLRDDLRFDVDAVAERYAVHDPFGSIKRWFADGGLAGC